MNDSYFYDGGGAPLTGKVPVQVFIHGSGDSNMAKAAAAPIVRTFLTNARLSLADHHNSSAQLPGGGLVQMRQTNGVTRVDIYTVPGGGVPTEPFYGGIVIEPTIITNEAAYLTSSTALVPTLLEAAKTSGKTPGLPGRPSVPGVGTLETDRLVVQIHPTKSLTDQPIKNGAVRIYRMRAPKVGDLFDPDERAHYVVSTVRPGTEFYVCGQKMTRVPAFPTTIFGNTGADGRVRTTLGVASLHAIDLEVESFATAALAEVTLVVAVPTASPVGRFGSWTFRLYAVNTRQRTRTTPATWQMLQEVTLGDADFRPNSFGTTFTESFSGTRIIRCAGTNGAGTCSGWQISIASNGTITGGMNIERDGATAPRDAALLTSYEVTYFTDETENVDAISFIYPTFSEDLSGPSPVYSYLGPEQYSRHVGYKAVGFREAHTLTTDFDGGRLTAEIDTFLGGAIPAAPTVRYLYTGIGSTTCEYSGLEYRLKGTGWSIGSGVEGVYDQTSLEWVYGPIFGGGGPAEDVTYPETSNPLYLGASDRASLYGYPFTQYRYLYHPSYESAYTYGMDYPFVMEFSGELNPYVGIFGVVPPASTVTSLYSTPAYYLYNLNSDGTDPDPDYEKYPYTAPVPAWQDLPPQTSSLIYDMQPICAYPKKAAIFDCNEQWTADVEVSGGSPFDGIFSATASRVGQTYADEYLADMFATNVDAFPAIATPVFTRTDTGDLLPDMAGSFSEPPFARFGYSAREATTNKLAWRSEQFRSGTWIYEAPETMAAEDMAFVKIAQYTENAGPRQVSMSLTKPDGTVILKIDDILALFPRTPAIAMSASFVSRPLLNEVGKYQWPLRYNNPEHPELDRTDLASNPFVVIPPLPFSPDWQFPIGSSYHLHYPQLITAYWGRSATGVEFSPKFPAQRFSLHAENSYSGPGPEAGTLPGGTALALIPGVLSTGATGGISAAEGDVIYYDPRTGGYLTTLHWRTTDSTGIDLQAAIETYIGNASGIVPFKPILDEWIALGTLPAQDYTKILLSASLSAPSGSPPLPTRLV